MNEFQNHEYEEEISLKQLLIYVLRKWRTMIAAAVVLGLVLGGVKAVKGFIDLQDPEKVEESIKESELARQNYDTAKAQLTNQMAEYNRQIDDYQKYQDNSLYMKIDPYAVYKESITYVVTTDYQILPNMTYQTLNWMGPVLSAYTTVANSVTLKDLPPEGRMGLSEEWDADSLEKLVKVETNTNDGKLTITASAESEARAKAILQVVREKVEANQENVAKAAGEHKLSLISEKSTVTVDQTIINDRETRLKNVTALREAADKAELKYRDLREPSDTSLGVGNIIKSAVKFGVLGAFAGIFLVCCMSAGGFLLDGVLRSQAVMSNRFHTRVLAALPSGENNSKVDRMLDKMEGNDSDPGSFDIALRTAAVGLERVYAGKTIVLLGSVLQEDLKTAAEHFAECTKCFTVVCGGNLLKEADAVRVLQEADAAVLVEKRNASRLSDIEREMEIIQYLGKNVEGCILL